MDAASPLTPQDIAETNLMKHVYSQCGAMIHAAAEQSSIPESFLAALVANESGGDLAAQRFEPRVLLALWEVLLGRKTAYGSIVRAELVKYVASTPSWSGSSVPPNLPADAFQRVDALATSWGYTQVMGYNALDAGKPVDYLRDARGCLDFSIAMLARFSARFQLDVTREFTELFECWNTGHPGGQTADPNYAANGVKRMAVYEAISR